MIGPDDIVRLGPKAGLPTLESMRADIARMLHEDVSEIGDDDDLMDLGLDSMRAMNLVLKWSESGLPLEFSEFAERTTLAGWWRLVSGKIAEAGNGHG